MHRVFRGDQLLRPESPASGTLNVKSTSRVAAFDGTECLNVQIMVVMRTGAIIFVDLASSSHHISSGSFNIF